MGAHGPNTTIGGRAVIATRNRGCRPGRRRQWKATAITSQTSPATARRMRTERVPLNPLERATAGAGWQLAQAATGSGVTGTSGNHSIQRVRRQEHNSLVLGVVRNIVLRGGRDSRGSSISHDGSKAGCVANQWAFCIMRAFHRSIPSVVHTAILVGPSDRATGFAQ